MGVPNATSAEGSRPPSTRAPDEGPELAFREALKWLSAGLVLIYGGFTVQNLRQLSTPGVARVVSYDLVVMGACAGVLVLLRYRRPSLAVSEAIGFGLASLLALNTALSALAVQSPADLGYVPFILVGAGATLFHLRWLIATLVVSVAATATVLYLLEGGPFVVFTTASLAAGAVTSGVFMLARQRSQACIDALRREERQRSRELESTLSRLGQELTEHQRAEDERQLLEAQLRQTQQLESLGVLAGGVAHDMNNVLGAISALCSAALDDLGPDQRVRTDLEQILIATSRGSALTRNLLGFARKGQQVHERVDTNELVQEVARHIERTAPRQVAIVTELDRRLGEVFGDPGQLAQVLTNLCLNGVEAVGGAGKLVIRTLGLRLDEPVDDLAPGPYASISVTDDGAGMPAEVAARAFEPFFTTKDPMLHSGLGLSMVYGAARQHNGRVRISSAPGRGTVLTLDLPSTPPQRGALDTGSRPAAPREERTGTVLLVDDDPLLRAAGRRLLGQLGMKSLDARDGREALELFRQHQPEISLVILDVVMPIMDGVECFWELKRIDDSVRVLLSSGYPRGNDLDELFAAGAVGYLAKPYEKAPFARAVTSALTA